MAQFDGRARPVCAACGGPADEGRCSTCRPFRNRPPEDHGRGPALLALAAALLVTWVGLLLLAH
ncbi:hypothetical protein EV189_1837 [Motilibacter rhizosphaerae]|uniref:Uncharacterized protein n=1 Tax=Motilibacter rhizosphaerae TaxID=598652 RepID=A0A4Q7NSV1_9ACTN|nr:hypothetical protein [Motilibacter rhizosphaerae]RZS90054.1 hypothetical protein EV189_1837 [Motilibacter rhizosphaerae]